MAFSSSKSGGTLTPLQGDGLARIEAESLGFLGLNGDAQVRLTSKWDPLPPPTASLLAIAQHSGWLAAGGPDSLVLAETNILREAFKANPESPDGKIRPFTPHIKIEIPGRITHVAFTSDEKYLVVSSEPQGALNVFDTQSLFNGSTRQPSFQIPTNGEPLRSLVPNPAKEKAELVAVVTTNGNLLVANMSTKSFEGGQPGQNGSVLRTNTSCVAWSTRGKQLVAGTAEGFIFQMTPSGEIKARLPCAPGLESGFYVDTLAWLENDLFFAVYVSTSSRKSSDCRLISRDPSGAKFQQAEDFIFPSDMDRVPHNPIVRLKDFPPAIQDMLIVSSSVSSDIGLLSRATSPLAKDRPGVVNVFATCSPRDDSRRAGIPQNDDWEDTWVVGASLDLSSSEKVYQPLPEDPEVEYSRLPVPAYWILNHEGILVGWWVIYDDSIRQGTCYSGMASIASSTAGVPPSPAAVKQTPTNQNGFAGSSKTVSPFRAPSNTASTFGTSNSPSPFGPSLGTKPGFGSSSGLGQSTSPWGGAAAAASVKPSSPFGATTAASPFGGGTGTDSKFGQSGFGSKPSGGSAFGQPSTLAASSGPAFGQPSSMGKPAAFGQTSSLGMGATPAFGQASGLVAAKVSPWGSAAPTSTPTAPGQSGFGASSQAKTFGSSDASKPAASSGGAFSSFANTGGFGSLAAPSGGTAGQSIFAQSTPGESFKSDVSMGSSFGGTGSKPSACSTLASPFSAPPSGLSSEPFKLGTTFERDPNDTDVHQKPPQKEGPFGSGFGSALGAAAAEPAAKEVEMGTEQITPKISVAQLTVPESTTPTTTPAPTKYTIAAPAPSIPGGEKTQQPSSILFGSTNSEHTPKPQPPLFGASTTPQAGSIFGGTKDAKPAAATSVFNMASEKKAQASSLFSQKTPSGGLFSNVNKSTPGSSMFGATKSPPSGNIFSNAQSRTDTTTPEKPNVAAEPSNNTPLPPHSTSKSTYPFGDSSSSYSSTFSTSTIAKAQTRAEEEEALSGKVANDAPLPPDFVTKKIAPEIVPEPAPLPPDPTTMPKVLGLPLPPLPGAKLPPKDASTASPFAKPTLPIALPSAPSVPDSFDDDEFSEAGRESEGSGVDVAKDLSPPGTITKTPGFTPQSSFGGMGGSTFSSVSRPEPQSRLFGEMGKNAPILPKPPMFTSPRSPSPVRGVPTQMPGSSAIVNLRNSEMRSVSAPGMASQILGNSSRMRPAGGQSGLGTSIIGKVTPIPNLMEPHLKAKAKREAEELQILVDDQDDQIQRILEMEPHLTRDLDEFIAHSNVQSREKDQTIPAQVEAVYRDINSMIDIIGLNARSLMGFVQAHSTSAPETGRCREDLEDPEDWVLSEVEDLNEMVEIDLADSLDEGRVREIDSKKAACLDLGRELNRLRARQDDLRKIIMTTTDPDMMAANRALPLSSEQGAQQADLRKEYMSFSKVLAEAEESLVMLKTKVATAAAASGRAGIGGNVPTVDAIMRTIQRMTSMAEKKSGDIDVLETQMRKLRFSSLGAKSPHRDGSSFLSTPGKGRPNSSIFSPGRSLILSNSVMSLGSSRGTPRKKLSGYTDEEKRELMERRRARKDVLDKVKMSLEKFGPRIVPLEE